MVGEVRGARLVPGINHTQDGLDTVRVAGAGLLLPQPPHHTERPGQMSLQVLDDRQFSRLLLRSVLEAAGIFVGRTVGGVGGVGLVGGILLVLLVLMVPVLQSAAV